MCTSKLAGRQEGEQAYMQANKKTGMHAMQSKTQTCSNECKILTIRTRQMHKIAREITRRIPPIALSLNSG